MTLWIINTGDSDVQLKTPDHWEDLYDEAKEENSVLELCDDFKDRLQQDTATKLFTVPARALGLVYHGARLEKHYDDLAFPLLKTFSQFFAGEVSDRPNQIIVFLTDQTQIFDDNQKQFIDCPYWRDTCKIAEILKCYLSREFGVNPQFFYIKPHEKSKGVDNWNEMLTLVNKELEKALSSLGIERENETVYVSHQAGTPAISSALQFLTISKLKKVNFLISNRFYDEGYETKDSPDLIDVKRFQPQRIVTKDSNYWRGLQIQKAKKLIISGNPGAALELAGELVNEETRKNLQAWVDVFNIKATVVDKQKEFEPENAIKRVRQTLDLIEKFFQHENYIQGVTLLAASQETFLKATIISLLNQINFLINTVQVSNLVVWDQKGLRCKDIYEIHHVFGNSVELNQLINGLKVPNYAKQKCIDFYKNRNDNKFFEFNLEASLKWLNSLGKLHNKYWYSLVWSCTTVREYDYDRRNQLMHNLRGIEKIEVIHYLLGCPEDPKKPNPEAQKIYQKYANITSLKVNHVTEVYDTYVKKPFLATLKKFGWDDEALKYKPLQERLEVLANSLDTLDDK